MIWSAPEKVIYGVSCHREMFDYVPGRRILLVTGRNSARESGVTDVLVEEGKKRRKECFVFAGVEAEPELSVVEECRRFARERKIDAVVAVGGGSVIDVGKAAAGLFSTPASVAECFEGKEIPRDGIFFGAVPTTGGTGSEATSNGVFIDKKNMVKKSIRAPHMTPDLAVLDPVLTVSCPPEVTAHAGMDALVHGIESLFSRHATPLTAHYAASGIMIVNGAIEKAYREGGDIAARSDMIYGAFIVGTAFANSRVGAVHGLAHPVGVLTGTPHGLVCARLVIPVLKRNRTARPDVYASLGKILGEDPLERLSSLLAALGIEERFNAAITKEDLDRLFSYTAHSASMKANPILFSEEEQREIIEEAGIVVREG